MIDLGSNVYNDIKKNQSPSIKIPMRALSNTEFDEKAGVLKIGDKVQSRAYLNLGQSKKFMQTLLLASAIYEDLIKQGINTSIRDIFYRTKHTIAGTKENTFDEQDESNPILEDLEVSLNALREELHLYASSKGSCVGNMTVIDTGDKIDLRKMGSGGWHIPSIMESSKIQFKDIDADFVLFIEKDAVWGRLNEDKFWKKNNCIIIHGGGMAPRGVRRLLYRLNKEHKLPIICLVDNDPAGFYIYSVIKQGSIKLAYESMRMATTPAKFLGLRSMDQEKYELPNNVTIKLNEWDLNRAKEILNYAWFQKKQWQEEIRLMLKKGVKLELEALSSKHIRFISQEYLPEKIENKEWLE